MEAFIYMMLLIIGYVCTFLFLFKVRWWRIINWPFTRILGGSVTVFEEGNYHLAENLLGFRTYRILPLQPLIRRIFVVITMLWPVTVSAYLLFMIFIVLLICAAVVLSLATFLLFALFELFNVQNFSPRRFAEGKLTFIQNITKSSRC